MPSRYWYLKAAIINILLFIVLFFLTTPAIIVTSLDQLHFDEKIRKMASIN